jgi:hypothetical protein
MSMINRQVRLLQYQVSVIENDLKLMGEEIKLIANREALQPDAIPPAGPTDV